MINTIKQDKINYYQVLMISLGLGIGFDLISFIPEYLIIDAKIITISFRALYFLLCLVVIFKNKDNGTFSKSFIPLILFFTLYIIRSIFDSFYEFKNLYFFLLEFWIFIFMLIIIPISSFSCRINLITLNKAKFLTFFLSLITNILGLLNNNLKIEDEFKGGRLSGNLLMNPVTFGQMGVILVAICITYLMKATALYRVILLFCIIIGVYNIALAGSRGPLIELVLIILLFLVVNFKKIKKIYIILMILLIFIVSIYFSKYFFYFDTAISRLESTGQEERNFLFQDAINKIIYYPIFGYQAIGSYPHNLLLESLMAIGIIGGILILLIYYQSLKCIIFLIKNEHTSWLSLVLFMYTFSSIISGSIFNSIEFWTLLSLCLYITSKKVKQNIFL